jgi:hypothetical protein
VPIIAPDMNSAPGDEIDFLGNQTALGAAVGAVYG